MEVINMKKNACKENQYNVKIIRIDSKAGHGAGKPISKVIEEQADIYAFIMYNLQCTIND